MVDPNTVHWWPEIVGAFFGALVGASVAIFTIWYQKYTSSKQISCLKAEKVVYHPQRVKNKYDDYYFRIFVKNESEHEAINATARVIALKKNEEKVEPYLNGPLKWTHKSDSPERRNILPHRAELLDLFLFRTKTQDEVKNPNKLTLLTNAQYLEEFCLLDKGKNSISVEIDCDNGNPIIVAILVEWSGGYGEGDLPKTKVNKKAIKKHKVT